jgi:hypothetical protein
MENDTAEFADFTLTYTHEFQKTRNGCQVSRNSLGEWVEMYYENPPSGDGWVAVKQVIDGQGPWTIWCRVVWLDS